jgi:hypothetical protein
MALDTLSVYGLSCRRIPDSTMVVRNSSVWVAWFISPKVHYCGFLLKPIAES